MQYLYNGSAEELPVQARDILELMAAANFFQVIFSFSKSHIFSFVPSSPFPSSVGRLVALLRSPLRLPDRPGHHRLLLHPRKGWSCLYLATNFERNFTYMLKIEKKSEYSLREKEQEGKLRMEEVEKNMARLVVGRELKLMHFTIRLKSRRL